MGKSNISFPFKKNCRPRKRTTILIKKIVFT